jgi:hypothetical protein
MIAVLDEAQDVLAYRHELPHSVAPMDGVSSVLPSVIKDYCYSHVTAGTKFDENVAFVATGR